MNPHRWQQIEEIYFSAFTVENPQRAEFLRAECGGDRELYDEVVSLIEETDENDSFLSESLLTLGLSIISNEEKESLINCRIGRYKIVRLLGEGGMGEVYLATDESLSRKVALKLLPAFLTDEIAVVQRFRREARAASSISHQNIAHIYEAGKSGDQHFIAMEYIEGETLRAVLRSSAAPDIPRALAIAAQIADALAAAHRAGVIHRDIKPENIIIQTGGAVKVLDFGLAKLTAVADETDASAAANLKTTSGLIMGTIAYMSPEQIRAQTIEPAADIWSLGVVLYEMLTGTRPFEAETKGDLIAAILTSDAALPRRLNSEINARLESVVLKMLRKNAGERYADAGELLADLRVCEKYPDSKTARLMRQTAFAARRATGHQHGKYFAALAVAVVCAVLIFGAATALRLFDTADAENFSIGNFAAETIAVLPFVDENGKAENEYLADGLTESLINRLSLIKNLTVKARSSVFFYKNKAVSPLDISRELSAQAVLRGRIAENGNDLTVNLEMINGRTGSSVWKKLYRLKTTDIAALETEMARDVSQALQSRLSATETQKIEKKPTNNAEAMQLYMRGRFHWNKRTSKDLQKAIAYFEQATTLDPNFALVFAALAESYTLASGYAISTPHESFPKARAAAERALKIDDSLAEAHNALAYVLFNYEWNFAESEREAARAIALNPNYATAFHWFGNANLLAMGKFDESISALRRAQELDPLSLIVNADLATNYLFARRTDEAIEQFRKTLEMDDNFYYAHAYLGRAYLMKNSFPEALAELKKAQTLSDDPRIYMLFARTYAKMGDRKNALKMLARLKDISRYKYVSPYYFALVYAGLNEKDQAFAWLETALREREGRMTLIKVDPLLDDIRSDARFPDYLRRVGLEP